MWKQLFFSREAKFENFVRGLWHVKIISLVLSKAEQIGTSLVRFPEP